MAAIDPGGQARMTTLLQIVSMQITQSSVADAKFVGLLGINIVVWGFVGQPFYDKDQHLQNGHVWATVFLGLSAWLALLGLLIPRAAVYLHRDPLANSAVIPTDLEIETATILYRREVKRNENALTWKSNVFWWVLGLAGVGLIIGAQTTSGLGHP